MIYLKHCKEWHRIMPIPHATLFLLIIFHYCTFLLSHGRFEYVKWLLAQPERVFTKPQFCADLVRDWNRKKELLSNSRPGAGERSAVLIDTNFKMQCSNKKGLKMWILLLWKEKKIPRNLTQAVSTRSGFFVHPKYMLHDVLQTLFCGEIE